MKFDGTIRVRVKRLSPLAERFGLPDYATPGSAGMDLFACIEEPAVIHPGERLLVPTGIAIQLPGPHVGAFLFARSGLAAKHGVQLANGVGVVDSDYTGEVKCALLNVGSEPFWINPGDRIAQVVFLPVLLAELLLVDELEPTERGDGGFGHTGL